MVRAFVITLFGIAPALLFFWWMWQGCRFAYDLPLPLYGVNVPADVLPIFNAGLMLGFGIIHSGSAELNLDRALYSVIAGLTALTVIVLWQPVNGTLWALVTPNLAWWFGVGQSVLWLALHAWLVRQHGTAAFFGWDDTAKRLVTSGPNAWVRHPMHAWILLNLLLTPVMTADRLTMFVAVVLYLFAAIPEEERRLEEAFGVEWRAYAARTPRLIPYLRGLA